MLFVPWICIAGAAAFALPFELENGPPKQLPALSRYEPPSFPESLRLTSISAGDATMLFTIDDQGRVIDSIASEASHPAFEQAMHEAFATWRFEPAPSASTPRRELIRFDFRRSGIVSSLSHREASKSAFPDRPAEHERAIRTVDWRELAVPLQRIRGAAPVYPSELRARGEAGAATVSFVVDRNGHVRVPVIAVASDARFGAAALKAVQGWRFAAPRDADGTVNVRLERTFTFGRRRR